MKCPVCGKIWDADNAFCAMCGAALVHGDEASPAHELCVGCGKPISSLHNFCEYCGQPNIHTTNRTTDMTEDTDSDGKHIQTLTESRPSDGGVVRMVRVIKRVGQGSHIVTTAPDELTEIPDNDTPPAAADDASSDRHALPTAAEDNHESAECGCDADAQDFAYESEQDEHAAPHAEEDCSDDYCGEDEDADYDSDEYDDDYSENEYDDYADEDSDEDAEEYGEYDTDEYTDDGEYEEYDEYDSDEYSDDDTEEYDGYDTEDEPDSHGSRRGVRLLEYDELIDRKDRAIGIQAPERGQPHDDDPAMIAIQQRENEKKRINKRFIMLWICAALTVLSACATPIFGEGIGFIPQPYESTLVRVAKGLSLTGGVSQWQLIFLLCALLPAILLMILLPSRRPVLCRLSSILGVSTLGICAARFASVYGAQAVFSFASASVSIGFWITLALMLICIFICPSRKKPKKSKKVRNDRT